MTQHTPAPWSYRWTMNHIVDGKSVGKNFTVSPVSKRQMSIAKISTKDAEDTLLNEYRYDFCEAEANARLIAAAPELLEALKLGLYLLTIPAVRDIMKSQLESGESSPIADFETSAHAVITKAKGK